METSFKEISDSTLRIVEFARCPYIHDIYSKLMLEGFCKDSYSGLYNIHVSHLATLTVFFALMVNAALLYPHYKGKTLKHLCCCLYSKEVLEKEDLHAGEKNEVHLFDAMYSGSDDSSDSECYSDEEDEEDEETGAVHVEMVEQGGRNDFAFVNPAFSGNDESGFFQKASGGQYMPASAPPSGAMVRVKAEVMGGGGGGDEPSHLLGDEDDYEGDVY
jgi:hypothetical protein